MMGNRTQGALEYVRDEDDGFVSIIEGLAYISDSTVALNDSAGKDLGVAGVRPYGDFYLGHFDVPDEDGIYPASALKLAIDTLPAGGVIRGRSDRVYSPYTGRFSGGALVDSTGIMDKASVTIIGGKSPDYNNGDTALEDGFIILGSFFFAADDFRISHFGIDVGEDYCTDNNNGVAAEGLIGLDREVAQVSGFEGGDPARKNVHIHAATVLAYGTDATPSDQSDVHSLLLENYDGHRITVSRFKFGGAGPVCKSSYGLWDGIEVSGSNKYGILNKGHADRPANHNVFTNITIRNYGVAEPDPTDTNDYDTSGLVIEAVDADVVNVLASNIITDGVRNGVQFYTQGGATGTVRNCRVENVTTRLCYGYDVLFGHNNVENCEVSGLKATGGRIGVACVSATATNCKVEDSTVEGSLQYSYRNTAGNNFQLVNCSSSDATFGDLLSSGGTTYVNGSIFVGRGLPKVVETGGEIIGLGGTAGAKFILGDNLVLSGDCEDTDNWDTKGGSTDLTIIAGEHAGNAMRVERSGAPAAYVSQQITVRSGQKYVLTFWQRNGTTSARFYLCKDTFADGYYIDGATFDVISNAGSWGKSQYTFTAESDYVFLTWQVPAAAGANFDLDEIELRAIPATVEGTLQIIDGVLELGTFTVATLPTSSAGGFIFVSDETGGPVTAFYDGNDWRRTTDREVVS